MRKQSELSTFNDKRHGQKRYTYTELLVLLNIRKVMILSIINTNNLRTCIGFVSIVAIPLLVITLIIVLFYSIMASLAFASDNTTVMRRLTNGSSLEVILAPLQKTPDDEMQFRVGFLQPNKNKLQEHVDPY